MVESIGTKPITADRGITRIAAVTPPKSVAPAAQAKPDTVTQTGALAQSLGAKPPVDVDRVAQVRQSIADGTFPMNPATAADSMIALRFLWTGEGKN
jgi:negative regulator of flagellin synthesis FlgM